MPKTIDTLNYKFQHLVADKHYLGKRLMQNVINHCQILKHDDCYDYLKTWSVAREIQKANLFELDKWKVALTTSAKNKWHNNIKQNYFDNDFNEFDYQNLLVEILKVKHPTRVLTLLTQINWEKPNLNLNLPNDSTLDIYMLNPNHQDNYWIDFYYQILQKWEQMYLNYLKDQLK